MRRLTFYFLIDTSGSMRGAPIEAVNSGMEAVLGLLRQDPYVLETVDLTVITFDAEVKIIVPRTPIEDVVLPQITTPRSGPTHLGLALETLDAQVRLDVRKGTTEAKGDHTGFLFVMTDGRPSDTQLYIEQCKVIRGLGFEWIAGFALGSKVKEDDLKLLCDQVVSSHTEDGRLLEDWFRNFLIYPSLYCGKTWRGGPHIGYV